MHAGKSVESKLLTSYLEPIHRKFSNSVNFALVGATARAFKYDDMYNLPVQLKEFIYFRNESISDNGELGEAEFRNALYTIDMGQNNITSAFKHGRTYDVVVSIAIPAIISNITGAIWVCKIYYYILWVLYIIYQFMIIYMCRAYTKLTGGSFGCTTPAPWVVCQTQ